MSVPKVSFVVVYLLIVAAISPILAAIWFATYISIQDSQGRYFLSLFVISMLLIACTLILVTIKISSIKISVEGVKQISFFSNNRLWSNQVIEWKDVERVLLRGLTYTLFSQNKKIVISLTSFGDYKYAGTFIDRQIQKSVERLHG